MRIQIRYPHEGEIPIDHKLKWFWLRVNVIGIHPIFCRKLSYCFWMIFASECRWEPNIDGVGSLKTEYAGHKINRIRIRVSNSSTYGVWASALKELSELFAPKKFRQTSRWAENRTRVCKKVVGMRTWPTVGVSAWAVREERPGWVQTNLCTWRCVVQNRINAELGIRPKNSTHFHFPQANTVVF